MENIRVLIVDDDELLRKQLDKELKRQYCETFLAADGKEVQKIIAGEQIDIVLLDVRLPDIDGLELIENIKKAHPDCEIIVVTGFGTQEIAIQALRRGAIDYLEKPVDMEQLTAALGRAHEKSLAKKELGYKNTLLVIDDDEAVVRSVSKFLRKEGYEVFTAFSGEEGLTVIEKNKIDVFITDYNMEQMNGAEVLEKAKKLYPDIEGIMVTAQTEEEVAIQALRAGASDYLNKPINLDELLIAIEKAIETINLNRNKLYRDRELKISAEIISKMNEELERRIVERSKELSQAQSQLFQTSKLATLGEMSTGLAHEMNQPLGGIALITASLKKMIEKDKLTDDELKEGLDDIEKSVSRMTKVIQHIRTFARQDTLKFVEVDINDTIESALDLLGEQLRLREVEVVLESGSDLPKISGEPYQLEQVWINFISNARDSMDDKAERVADGRMQVENYRKKLVISTSYDRDTDSVKVIFKDNGIGIAEDEKEKVLEPFFTTKDVGKGSGLGLSISYGIIQNHKGDIGVNGEEGIGAEMSVSIPCLK